VEQKRVFGSARGDGEKSIAENDRWAKSLKEDRLAMAPSPA